MLGWCVTVYTAVNSEATSQASHKIKSTKTTCHVLLFDPLCLPCLSWIIGTPTSQKDPSQKDPSHKDPSQKVPSLKVAVTKGPLLQKDPSQKAPFYKSQKDRIQKR